MELGEKDAGEEGQPDEEQMFAIVQDLLTRRDGALLYKSETELNALSLPDSPVRAADNEMLQELDSVTIIKLHTELRGVKVLETASDLALMAAVISSLRNKPLPHDLLVFGEIGLSGEIRPVPSGQERLKEAAKHGFKRAIVPKGNAPKESPKGLQVIAVTRLEQALDALFE